MQPTKVSSWINNKFDDGVGMECDSIVRYFKDIKSNGIMRSVEVHTKEIIFSAEELGLLKFFGR